MSLHPRGLIAIAAIASTACGIDLSQLHFACTTEHSCEDAEVFDGGVSVSHDAEEPDVELVDAGGGVCFMRDDASATWWCHSLSALEVPEKLAEYGGSISDLERAANGRYTIVGDKGDATPTTYELGATSARFDEVFAAQPDTRVFSFEPYLLSGGEKRYSVLFARDAVDGWYWWESQRASALDGINHPMGTTEGQWISRFARYELPSGSRYSMTGVFLQSAGRSIDFFLDLSPTELDRCLAHDVIPFDIAVSDPLLAATTSIIFATRLPSDPAYWIDYRLNAAAVAALEIERHAHVTNLEVYDTAEGRRFNSIMASDTATTAPVPQTLDAIFDGFDGSSGWLVRKVGGATLASAREDATFDPQGSLATLIADHAAIELAAGRLAGSATITPYLRTSDLCPTTATTAMLLGEALTRMMTNSDNAVTKGIVDRFGLENLDLLREDLGMTSTELNGSIGCARNQTTLRDLSRLYEKVLPHASFIDAYDAPAIADREYLGARMRALIDEEGAVLGLSVAQLRTFKTCAKLRYKSGRNGNEGMIFNGSIAGGLDVPESCPRLCDRSGHYVFGTFVESGTSRCEAETRYWQARAELLRPALQHALEIFQRGCR